MCVARGMKKGNLLQTQQYIVWKCEEEMRGGWKGEGQLEVSGPS